MVVMRKRRKTFKRRRTFKKRKVATVKAVKSMISRSNETKWLNGDMAVTPDNTVATVEMINDMKQGDTRLTRTGNRIQHVGLRATITIEPNGAAQLATRVRLMLVLDKQCNGANIAGGDLFAPGVPAGSRFYAAYNMNTVPSRYKILWDKLILLKQVFVTDDAAGAIIQVGQQPVYFRKRFRLKGFTKYNEGDTGTVTDIISPGLQWVIFSSQGAAQAPLVTINYDFMFKDA